jgi:HPt (histidine-containing phosphotransfer) domain-containing protein
MNDGTSSQDKLKQQLDTIGARYIARTLGEMDSLKDTAQQALNGSPSAFKDVEHLAHKIHGSGAMFGFDRLSECAGEVEHIAGFLVKGEGPDEYKALGAEALREKLRAGVARLDELARAAAQERGIAVNAS